MKISAKRMMMGMVLLPMVMMPTVSLAGLTIAQDTAPDTSQEFTYSGDDGAPVQFMLKDDGSGVGNTYQMGTTDGTYTVAQTLPAGWTFVSLQCKGATNSTVNVGTGVINVVGGENVTCTFSNAQNCAIPSEVLNAATVWANEPESNSSDNTGRVCFNKIGNIDLQLTKTSNVTSAKRGDTIVYTLTLENTSTNDATGVEAQDILPAILEYVSSAGDGVYTSSTGVWVIGAVPAKGKKILTITVKVK